MVESKLNRLLYRLSTDNLPSVLEFARQHGLEDLRILCMNSIIDHFDEFSSHHFLTADEMCTCLTNDCLGIKDEASVLDVIHKWLQDNSATPENTQKMIKCVRLENIPPEVIREFTGDDKLPSSFV